jgi:hypothetical protein
MRDYDDDEAVTIKEACRLLGGNERPLNIATYYRGAKAGIYPKPGRVSPNSSRVSRNAVIAARNRFLSGEGDE